jgi:hypothetical protein
VEKKEQAEEKFNIMNSIDLFTFQPNIKKLPCEPGTVARTYNLS